MEIIRKDWQPPNSALLPANIQALKLLLQPPLGDEDNQQLLVGPQLPLGDEDRPAASGWSSSL